MCLLGMSLPDRRAYFSKLLEDLQRKAEAATAQEDLCCGSPCEGFKLVKSALRKVKTLRLESDAYIKVVLKGFWSGSVTRGEAKVVLKGVFVSHKLLDSFPRVGQFTSDGTEFL